MTVAGKSLVVGAAVLALTACGGDGSSFDPTKEYTGPKDLITVDGDNAAAMASQANAVGSGYVTDSYGGAYLKTGSSATLADLRKARELLKSVRRSSGVSLVGFTGSGTEQCTMGGSMTVSYRIADPERTSAGDYVSITFDACNEGGYETVNGTLRLTVTGTDGQDPEGGPTMLTPGVEYGFSITMMAFEITDHESGLYSRTSGDVKFSVLWNATTKTFTEEISGAGIASEAGDANGPFAASLLAPIPGTSKYRMRAQQVFADADAYDFVSEAWGMSARVCSMELEGCLDIAVDPQFVTYEYDVNPSSGKLKVTGAGGAYVQVEATNADGSITVTWDVDGTGPTAPESMNTTWYCLDNPCVY